MAETIRMVDYFYVMTGDKPGEGARILSHLRDAGVNLLAVHAFPSARRTQVDLVPSSADALRAAARAAKWKLVGPKKAFLIDGDDRTGALVDIMRRLAAAKVNVTATSASAAGMGRFGALLWVKSRDVKRAAAALGAA